MIDWLPNGLVAHNLDPPKELKYKRHVLDIGAGVRPMQWYRPSRHVCVEPHGPYADRLEACGYEVIRASASEALMFHVRPTEFGAIYLLDVIEHMKKPEGQFVIDWCLKCEPEQIVVFTPLGFLKQDGPDPWGLGGEQWQEHRSGWMPQDFPGWAISEYGRGFFAVWTRTAS